MNEKTSAKDAALDVKTAHLESDLFTCPECGSHITLTSENWHLCQKCKQEWYEIKTAEQKPSMLKDLGGRIE